jgi:hypothetical protein
MDTVTECIVFLSHHTAVGAMQALGRLRQQCGSTVAIVPLFDQTHKTFPTDDVPDARRITCAEVTAHLPYFEKHKQHPGTFWPRNIDLPLMWFFRLQPQYDYYWLMEYDVRLTGSWVEFFRHFATSNSDLLATTIFDYDIRPKWRYWETLKSPQPIPHKDRVRALFPLYRVSGRALRALHLAYCDGWSGHYEVTIPTLLKTQGFPLEDIGGDGAYVAPNNRNRFYRNNPGIAGLAPGTLTVAANQISDSYPQNMLWHPIKG